MKKSVKKEYFVMGAVLLILCYMFPYTGDDWAWGSSIGIERLSTWFDNYSGRYFGNLIVLALTRSNILKTVTMAICLSGIVIFLDKLTMVTKTGFYIIVLNLLFMPVVILRQAIVWTAGFANYTTSIFLTLIYIYYVRNIYEKDCPKYSKWCVLPIFILGVANTLIVEHLTIYNVVLSVYVIIFTLIKFKKVYVTHISYFIGTCAGTLYMFSNSVYSSVSNGQDGYRTISSEQGVIYKAVKNYLEIIVEEGFLNNIFLNSCLVVVCLLVWKHNQQNIKEKKFVKSCLMIMVAYLVCSFMNWNATITQLKLLRYLEGGATILFVLALIGFILVLPVDWVERIKLLFILGSAGCMIAPLLVVSPIGSRCFFASYVMFIYLILELFQFVSPNTKAELGKMKLFLSMIAVCAVLYLTYIYGTIFVCDRERVEQARNDAASGAETIIVENLPYDRYLWCSAPTVDTVWEERFKLFYGIDTSIRIENKACSMK